VVREDAIRKGSLTSRKILTIVADKVNKSNELKKIDGQSRSFLVLCKTYWNPGLC